jgi:WD40 repeat protein
MTLSDGKKAGSADARITPRVNPYVGPRPYLAGEELFGRDREKRDLFDQLLAERIVLLHSPSGAGKSSLVNASLIPMLRKEGLQDLPVVRVGEEPDLKYSSQDGFNRFVYSTLLSLEGELTRGETEESKVPGEAEAAEAEVKKKSRLDELAGLSLESYLDQRRQKLGTDLNVLIFDQFEEIITAAPTDIHGKQVFFDQLGEALSDRSLWALFVIRDDFLGALEPFAQSIPTQLGNTFRLDLLNSDAARQAIQKPVTRQGITFLDSAADRLVDDLRVVQTQTPSGEIVNQLGYYVEPVQLQVVCRRLYDRLDLAKRLEKTQIDDQDIKNVGDVGAALAGYYAEQVAATAGSVVVERLVRDWFDEKLITTSGLRSQVMMEVSASGGLDNALIRQLEKAHLVRAEKRRGVTWFELAHDRLVGPVQRDNERWRRESLNRWQLRAIEWQKHGEPDSLLLRGNYLDEFREWADEHQAELNEIDNKYLQSSLQWREAHLSPLQNKAAEWDTHGRPQQLLLGGVDLRQASDWALANTVEITSRELKFLEASREAAQEAIERERRLKLEAAEQLAEAERRRSEEQALAAARLRRRAYFLGAVLVIAVILASLAFAGFQIAQEQRSLANTASTQAINEKDSAKTAQVVSENAQKTSQAAQVTAIYNANQARQKEAEARDQAIKARALGFNILASNLLKQKLDLALLLSIEGIRLENLPETRQALFRAWTQSSGIYRFLSGHSSAVTSVAWSPDGRLASGSDDGTIIVWDLATGSPALTLEGHAGTINGLAWSADGRLASGSYDGTIMIWDLATGTPAQTLEGHSGTVYSVAWSPDGRLASGSSDDTVTVWDLASGTPARTLKGHSDAVSSVAWSTDGRLASASWDGRVIVWDLKSGTPEQILEGHSGTISSVAWSADGRLASGSYDDTVIVWDLATGTPAQTLEGHTEAVSSVAWSSDGRLASASYDGTVITWDLEGGAPGRILEGHSDSVYSLAWSVDGRLASGSYDDTVIAWDLATSSPARTLEGHSDWVYSVAWSADRRLASGSEDGTAIVWDLATGSPAMTLEGQAGTIYSVAWSPDGRLASGSSDGTVTVWDLATGFPTRTLDGHSGTIYSVAWSPDGNQLAAGTYDGKVIVWDLANGSPARTLKGHSDVVRSLAWSADGRLASASWDDTVIVWDLATGSPGRTLEVNSDYVSSVAWSPNGWLAAGSYNGAVTVWDPASDSAGRTLKVHTDAVSSLGWSPDGRLASASWDGTVIVWDLASGQPELTLDGQSGEVYSVAWSPDGSQLASGTSDRFVQVWPMDAEVWIEQACQRAGHNFTQAEWAQYIPDEAYHKTCEQWP